jgi:hypothetical protein
MSNYFPILVPKFHVGTFLAGELREEIEMLPVLIPCPLLYK